jgi:hypothetical protein
MLVNLLFLFRKIREVVQSGLDLVQPPNMAHSLLYSKNHTNSPTKKSDKRSNKMRFLLDKPPIPCYNIYITIGNQPNAAFLPTYSLSHRSTGKKLAQS